VLSQIEGRDRSKKSWRGNLILYTRFTNRTHIVPKSLGGKRNQKPEGPQKKSGLFKGTGGGSRAGFGAIRRAAGLGGKELVGKEGYH